MESLKVKLEAEWGADPLEKFGGFRNLSFDQPTAGFASALPQDGVARWNTTTAAITDSTRALVNVAFTNVDWGALRSVYGWSGIQYQAWVRGILHVCRRDAAEPAPALARGGLTVTVDITGAGEFWIDGEKQYFGGDFYGFRRAPAVVRLPHGKCRHTVDVRVTHDIRAFGGGMPPVPGVGVEVKLAKEAVVAVSERVIVADVVEGVLVAQWASVPVRNEGVGWVEVVAIWGKDVSARISLFSCCMLTFLKEIHHCP